MNFKLSIIRIAIFLFICVWYSTPSYTMDLEKVKSIENIENYQYSRDIKGEYKTWNLIELPVDILEDLHYDRFTNVKDIKLYGKYQDKYEEIPYLEHESREVIEVQEIPIEIVSSTSRTAQGFEYLLFFDTNKAELQESNKLSFEFADNEYDWLVDLDGKRGNKSAWENITSNLRFLSVKYQDLKYTSSTINIPKSDYSFYRLRVRFNKKEEIDYLASSSPILSRVYIKQNTITKEIPRYYDYKIQYKVEENNSDSLNATNILIDLPYSVPLEFLEIIFKDKTDFYRQGSIKYLESSYESDTQNLNIYGKLRNITIDSKTQNKFYIRREEINNSVYLFKKIIINIINEDNAPLTVENIKVYTPVKNLIARFDKKFDDAVILYGNENRSSPPSYDLEKFKSNIPLYEDDKIAKLTVGDEISLHPNKNKTKQKKFFLESSLFLWIIVIIIIALLLWFGTVLKKSQSENLVKDSMENTDA